MQNKKYKIKLFLLGVICFVLAIEFYAIFFSSISFYAERKIINTQFTSSENKLKTASVSQAKFITTLINLAKAGRVAFFDAGNSIKVAQILEKGSSTKLSDKELRNAVKGAEQYLQTEEGKQALKDAGLESLGGKKIEQGHGVYGDSINSGENSVKLKEGEVPVVSPDQYAAGEVKYLTKLDDSAKQEIQDSSLQFAKWAKENVSEDVTLGGSFVPPILANAQKIEVLDSAGAVVRTMDLSEASQEALRNSFKDAISRTPKDADVIFFNKNNTISPQEVSISDLPEGARSAFAKGQETFKLDVINPDRLENTWRVTTPEGTFTVPAIDEALGSKALFAPTSNLFSSKATKFNSDFENLMNIAKNSGYSPEELYNTSKDIFKNYLKKGGDQAELEKNIDALLERKSSISPELRDWLGKLKEDSEIFEKSGEERIGIADPEKIKALGAALAATGWGEEAKAGEDTNLEPQSTQEDKPIESPQSQNSPPSSFTSTKEANDETYQVLAGRVDEYKKSIEQEVPDEYKNIYKTYADNHSTPTGQPTNYDDYVAKITGGEYQQAPPELAAAMAKYDNAVAVGQELKNDQFTGSLTPQTTGEWAGLSATFLPGVASGGTLSSLGKIFAVDKIVSSVIDYPANQSLKSHQENNSQQFQDFNTENKNLLDLKKQLLDHNLGINTLSDEDLGKLKEDISASQQKLSSLESEMKTRPYGYQETSEQSSISLPDSSEQVPIPASMLTGQSEEKSLPDADGTKTAASGETDTTTDAAPIGSASGGGLLEKFGSYVQSGYDSIRNFFTGGPETSIEQRVGEKINSDQQQHIRKTVGNLEESVATNQKILDQINDRIKEVSSDNSPESAAKLADLNASKDKVEKSLEDSQRLLGEYKSVLPETPTPELAKPGESNTVGQTEQGEKQKNTDQTVPTPSAGVNSPYASGENGKNTADATSYTVNDQGELVNTETGQPLPPMYTQSQDTDTATDAGTGAAASDRGLLGRTYDSISNYFFGLGEQASQTMGFKKGEGNNTDASGNPKTHQGILDQAEIGDQSSLQPGSSYEVNSEGKLVNTQTGEEFPSTQYAQGETNTANDGSRMGNQDVVSGGQQTYWDQFKGMWDDFQNRIFGTGDRSEELSQNGDRGDGTPLPNPIQPIKVAENDPEAGNNLPPIPNNEYNPSPAPEPQNIPDYAKYFSGNGTGEYPLDFNSSLDGKRMLDKITQIDWANNDVELKPEFEKDLDGFHGYLKLDKQEILDDKRELGEITPQQEQKLLSGDSNINVPDGTEIEDKETNKEYTTDDNSQDDNSDEEIDPDKTLIKL